MTISEAVNGGVCPTHQSLQSEGDFNLDEGAWKDELECLPENSLRDDSFEGFDDGDDDAEMLFFSRAGLSVEDWNKLYVELGEVWRKWVRRGFLKTESDDYPKAGLEEWMEEWRASMASGPDIYGWFTPFYHDGVRYR